jgi:hypothetical protein
MLKLRLSPGGVANALQLTTGIGQRGSQAHRIGNRDQPAVAVVAVARRVVVSIDEEGLKTLGVEVDLGAVFESANVRAVGISDQRAKVARRRCESIGAAREEARSAVTYCKENTSARLEMKLL